MRCDRWRQHTLNFYPRPPRGGRLQKIVYDVLLDAFLPTPSARRATEEMTSIICGAEISTHALREEGDLNLPATSAIIIIYFYPRPPRGGRRRYTAIPKQGYNFYPRPPRGGRLSPRCWRRHASKNFYPRPPRGGRPLSFLQPLPSRGLFLPTPSARRATSGRWQKILG